MASDDALSPPPSLYLGSGSRRLSANHTDNGVEGAKLRTAVSPHNGVTHRGGEPPPDIDGLMLGAFTPARSRALSSFGQGRESSEHKRNQVVDSDVFTGSMPGYADPTPPRGQRTATADSASGTASDDDMPPVLKFPKEIATQVRMQTTWSTSIQGNSTPQRSRVSASQQNGAIEVFDRGEAASFFRACTPELTSSDQDLLSLVVLYQALSS